MNSNTVRRRLGIASLFFALGFGGPAWAAPGQINFLVAEQSVLESDGEAQIQVERRGGASGRVVVRYQPDNFSAAVGDFVPPSGLLVWEDGEAGVKSFSVPVNDNNFEDGDRYFRVRLAAPVGGARLRTPSRTKIDHLVVRSDSFRR